MHAEHNEFLSVAICFLRFLCYTIPLGGLNLITAGSHCLHLPLLSLKQFEHRNKSQPSGDLNPSNMLSRYAPREPHTNQDVFR